MYNALNDILTKVPWDVLLQLVIDDPVDVTPDMVTAAWNGASLSALTPEEAAAATTGAAAITEALEGASSLVDGYCGRRCEVPFTTVPPFVKSLDLGIAVYHLFSRRENVPENRQKVYDNAVKTLSAISRGEITLGVQPVPAAVATGSPEVISSDRRFTRNSLRGL
ncbi:DUF1320 domain-containing protein [Geomonas sp. Red32]|uniref:DUF1320 domain-containing protein n=1 Tax=Geomonas sp. Red32 TaxID=2912856 RepID=UPI00202D0C25|nr:DUF1320 domain-containing protein [Geomonas sp. Red32]MCM0081780.1 DUF1320 domain-containing protein [Geomonas sp. Red32]